MLRGQPRKFAEDGQRTLPFERLFLECCGFENDAQDVLGCYRKMRDLTSAPVESPLESHVNQQIQYRAQNSLNNLHEIFVIMT